MVVESEIILPLSRMVPLPEVSVEGVALPVPDIPEESVAVPDEVPAESLPQEQMHTVSASVISVSFIFMF